MGFRTRYRGIERREKERQENKREGGYFVMNKIDLRSRRKARRGSCKRQLDKARVCEFSG